MKKRKPPEQSPPEFSHTPFKSLKGFTANHSGTAKKPDAPRKRQAQTEDDGELFLQAVSGVRKMHADMKQKQAGGTPENERKALEHPGPDREERLFLQAMQKIGAKFPEAPREDEEAYEEGRRSSTGRMRQLRRGTIRIGEELDLHGYLRDEALVRLEHFLSSTFARGLQAVLVITGKGINSPEGPVLRGAVSTWLQTKGRGVVAEFAPAPGNLGGSGAFVVFLKKRQ